MRKTFPAFAMAVAILWANQAWSACYKEDVQGGLDRSLPCVLHSPLPREITQVMFELSSSALDIRAKAILDQQAEILRRYPTLALTVWGHVDQEEAQRPDGDALGFRRAQAVRDYLVMRDVTPDRITTNSRGARWMIVLNPSEEAFAAMRFASTETEDSR